MNCFNSILISIFFIGCSSPEPIKVENNAGSKLSNVKSVEPFEEITSIENAKEKITESGKPGLIYFGAKIDVNSMKLEDEILSDSVIINTLIKEFTLFKAYVDEDMVISEDGIHKTSKYMDIMKEEFKNVYTPYIVIINGDGNIVDDFVGYPKIRDKILEFVKE